MSASIIIVSLLTLHGGDLKPVTDWAGVDTAVLAGFREKTLYTDESSLIGVWATSPVTFRTPEASNEEVLQVLSGSAEISGDDGRVLKVRPGDWVWMPGGTRFTWKYAGNFREAYVYNLRGLSDSAKTPASAAPTTPVVIAHTRVAGGEPTSKNEALLSNVPKIDSTLRVTFPTLSRGAALPKDSNVRTVFVISGTVTIDGIEHGTGSLFVIPASASAEVKASGKAELLEVETVASTAAAR